MMNAAKKTLLASLAVGLIAGAAGIAQADARQDFSILNSTGAPVVSLYVSSHDDNNWGDDVLGADILANGQTANIHFDSSTNPSQCAWDIKLVDSAGANWVVPSVDLCHVSAMTFLRRGNHVVYQTR